MSQVINVTEEDIQFAEQLLLPVGKTFDPERVKFIRNFRTIDLQAVPGSGKTTALLAKLIVLERKLPFADGSGILVLSHTNAAIDEIKDKIQKHCPRLFSYPNFIGTIQGFVDEFLAIPFYISKFNKKPIRIDNEIYNEKIKSCLEKLWLHKFNCSQDINSKVAYIKNSNEALFYDFRFQYSNGIQLVKKINDDILEIKKPRDNTKQQNYLDYSQKEKQDLLEWFLQFKKAILKSGILHFEDAYFLADVYLSKIPCIKTILQKRFSFVFVDEMQDMDSHQYNLLEKIFYDNGKEDSVIQRIGDRNQAIYNSSNNVKMNDIWQLRTNTESVLNLTGSQRLSKPIANIVKKFALYNDANFDIVGLNECNIKPHILVFENRTKNNIIPYFAQIVKEHKENGNLKSKKDYKDVKVVCWNTDWKEDETSRNDEDKLRLEDYHKGFKKEKSKPKQDYDNLKSYLLYYEKKKTLEPIRKSILNAFLKILRLENVSTEDNRLYTKKNLIDFIHEKDIKKYDELNLNLYNWSIEIIREKTNDVWNEIKLYVPSWRGIFDTTVNKSSNFINDDVVKIKEDNGDFIVPSNYYIEDGFEIEITSVHAVKGQTHCATLYLESYFHQDGKGEKAKSYESQRLKDQFLGTQIQYRVGERVKQSAKMAYVGFSRPTDLLCVAIHKDRFDSLLSTINTDIWEIKIMQENPQS
ncbi:MAG: ATP-dependent helicase [Bacteroidales bacterium]|nr:ATP-dependent helicase [Bacteroidales bacterium]